MTKNDLKSGMTVKLRDGIVCLVMDGFIATNVKFYTFKNFNENLSNAISNSYDIIEVYQYYNDIYNDGSNCLSRLLDLNSRDMKLIWKRKELPKLSSAERVILENIDKKYKWIARDNDGSLYAYSRKPGKYMRIWKTQEAVLLGGFTSLFKFVKWEDEQPYSIEELLKGE